MTAQLENLKSQQILFDADLIRSKAREEIELDHTTEKTKMLQEIEKWKQSYLNEKRKHELCRVEYDEHMRKTEKELNNMKEWNTKESSQLLRIMKILERNKSDLDNGDVYNSIENLNRKNKEMKEMYEELQQDLVGLRNAKEQVETELMEVDSLHQKEIFVSENVHLLACLSLFLPPTS